MPTLDWIGKDKVINHHLDVPYRVLERQYSYDENGQHTEDNGSENMIIHGATVHSITESDTTVHVCVGCPVMSDSLQPHVQQTEHSTHK